MEEDAKVRVRDYVLYGLVLILIISGGIYLWSNADTIIAELMMKGSDIFFKTVAN